MACNSSTGCQSGCNRDEDQVQDFNSSKATTTLDSNSSSTNLCIKCKANPAISTLSDATATAAAITELCRDCFRTNLFGKFRLAVTSHAMITPSDNVLVALSGGSASRVALQFVHEMQHRAQKNFDASRDRSLPVFGVGVAFIDESAIDQVPSHKVDKAVQEMRLLISNLSPPTKQLHVVPVENIYNSDSSDGKAKLIKLLDSVNDATGKEDLLHHLRLLALQKVAFENGYNRIILGLCTSRIACHVIAATVKGKGYSLSADIQHVDARWDVPVVLPLRDCTAQELDMLCHLDGLKTLQLHNGPPAGINGLVFSFVSVLQEENPSRESTIVRTAGKLTPFHFNRIPEIKDTNVPLATRRRQKRYNMKPTESISSELLCSICNSPVNNSDFLSSGSLEDYGSSNFGAFCCSSCRFQILPGDQSSMEHFSMLLPPALLARARHGNNENLSLIREKIQDFLLSDSEEEA